MDKVKYIIRIQLLPRLSTQIQLVYIKLIMYIYLS